MNRNCFSTIAAVVFTAVLVSCGGGTYPVVTTSQPRPSIQASVASPVKKATTVTGGNAVVIHLYQALYGMAPSNTLLVDYAFQANNDASLFAKNLTDRFATTSHADLAKLVLDNLGVTPTTVPAVNTKGESEYALLLNAVKQLLAAYPTMRGQVILNMTNLLAELETDTTYGAAATAYNGQTRSNLAYSSNTESGYTKSSYLPDVKCSIQVEQYGDILIPSVYLGAFPNPIPTQRVPSNVIKSIAFIDDPILWGGTYDIPAGNECKDQRLYSYNLIKQTLKRIKADGAERIHIYNSCRWDDFSKPIYACFTSSLYFLDKEAEKFIVEEAKKVNLAVVYSWQFSNEDQQGHLLDFGKITLADFKKMMTSYHKLIIEEAKYASQLGIDAIQADMQWPPLGQVIPSQGNYDPTFREVWLNEMYQILDDIRAVYTGKIIVGDLTRAIDSKIASKIDSMGITLFLSEKITAGENKNLTIEFIQNKYIEVIKGHRDDIALQLEGAIDIPISWRIEVSSRASQYTGDWIEPRCFDIAPDACSIFSINTDFSIQAIGVEASLRAISEQTYLRNYAIDINGYSPIDEIVPRTNGASFPNLAPTIRNKPAESIVRYWFGP